MLTELPMDCLFKTKRVSAAKDKDGRNSKVNANTVFIQR
jgi:hypothetical protein